MGSLLEGIDTAPAKGKAVADSGTDSKRTVKIVLAALCLIVGFVLIAMNLGLFGSGSSPMPTPGITPADSTQPLPQAAAPATGVKPVTTQPMGEMPLR